MAVWLMNSSESTGREDNSVAETSHSRTREGDVPWLATGARVSEMQRAPSEDRDLLSALRGLVSWAVI
jgi:hypothetical protein